MGYLFGSARSLFQVLPRGSTRDYIAPSGWWSSNAIRRPKKNTESLGPQTAD
jgi:hypothetical protein